MKQNPYHLFHHINQADEETSRYMCTYYSMIINLSFNCWIKITEEEVQKIAIKQAELWKFDMKWWGMIIDAMDAIIEFMESDKERFPKVPYKLVFHKTNAKFDEYLDAGYALTSWIAVNRAFVDDIFYDWKLDDFKDYKNYAWDLKHATTFLKWVIKDTRDYWKEYNLDSYFKHKNWQWLREIDLKEAKEDIYQNWAYLFCFEK